MMPACFDHLPRHGVLEGVARYRQLSVDDLRGPSRLPHIVRARWEVMTILRRRGLSLVAIGRIVNRDNTTVSHGLRRAG